MGEQNAPSTKKYEKSCFHGSSSFSEYHSLGVDFLSVGDKRVEVHPGRKVAAADCHARHSALGHVDGLDLLALHVVDVECGFGHRLGQLVTDLGLRAEGVGLVLEQLILMK